MSDNLDLVRSIYTAWEQGDYRSLGWAHPEIEWVRPDGPAPGTGTGFAGLAGDTRDFIGAWKDFRIAAEEIRELDNERVLVFVRYGGRGRASGVELGEVQSGAAHLLHVRDGKVTRLVQYLDRECALADLGIKGASAGDARLDR
jgi:ketosteroid isomerase-like protein